jgi:hypothetical protein
MKKFNTTSKFRKLILQIASLCFLCFGINTYTYAAGPGGGGGGGGGDMEKLIQFLMALADTTVKTVSEIIYQVIPSTGNTVTSQTLQISSIKNAAQQTEKMNDENLTKLFKLSASDLKDEYSKISQLSQNVLEISDLQSAKNQARKGKTQNKFAKAAAGNTNNEQAATKATPVTTYNFNAFVKPTGYTSDEDKAAKDFLDTINILNKQAPFSENILNAFAAIKNVGDEQKKAVIDSPAYKKFVAKLNAYNALKSIAMGNLMQFYAERTKPEKKGTQNNQASFFGGATSETAEQKSESLIETRNRASQWRLENPNWIKELAGASQTAIAREQTLLQAEILSKLNAMQTELEQQKAANAALIVILLQNLQQSLTDTENDLLKEVSDAQKAYQQKQPGQTPAERNENESIMQKLIGH